jgi:hypothetical protein
MNIEQAKLLNPWGEGTCSYSYSCLYPDSYYSIKDYNDDEDSIEYFPNLITLNTDYIKDDTSKFRITVKINGGLESVHTDDFDIELWKVNTDLKTYYRLENNLCSEKSLMTYENKSNDYESLGECEKKIIIDSFSYDESTDSCVGTRKTVEEFTINDYKTESECLSSKNIFSSIYNFIIKNIEIIGISLLVILLIIAFILYLKSRK